MTDQLTWQAPTVEIAGVEYQLRRLGIMDVMALGRIFASCQARQTLQVRALFGGKELSVETLGALLIAAIPYEAESICKFLASILLKPDGSRVEYADFINPDKFPLGSETEIIQMVIEHEDVAAFFERVKQVTSSGALARLGSSPSKSTSSKAKRGGQTK